MYTCGWLTTFNEISFKLAALLSGLIPGQGCIHFWRGWGVFHRGGVDIIAHEMHKKILALTTACTVNSALCTTLYASLQEHNIFARIEAGFE